MTETAEPRWLLVEEAVALNAVYVADTGENHFIRDQGLLEAAVMRPRHFFAYGEEDVLVLASSLLLGICQNHPFEQGNKRTGFGAMLLFLRRNGLAVSPDRDDATVAADVKRFIVEHRQPHEIRGWLATLIDWD